MGSHLEAEQAFLFASAHASLEDVAPSKALHVLRGQQVCRFGAVLSMYVGRLKGCLVSPPARTA